MVKKSFGLDLMNLRNIDLKISLWSADSAPQVHLGQLSINDSYTHWVGEHDGKNGIDLTPVLFKIWLLEEGYVLAKKYIDTLKKYFRVSLIGSD